MYKGIHRSAVIGAALAILFGTYAVAFAQTLPMQQMRMQGLRGMPQMQNSQQMPMPQLLSFSARGMVRAENAKVISISGSTINTTLSWGPFSQNVAVVVQSATSTMNPAAQTPLASIAVGDMLAFTGKIDTQSSATVIATEIVDLSAMHRAPTPAPAPNPGQDQSGNVVASGVVSSVNSSNLSFVISTHYHGNVTVNTTGTTTIAEGTTTVPFSNIETGMQIYRILGVYSAASSTIAASEVDLTAPQQAQPVTTPVTPIIPVDHFFSGSVGSLASTTAPTTIVIATSTATSTQYYTVNVSANTALLSYSWNPITLSQVSANHQLNVIGQVESGNPSVIDAYVLRDTNVQ